MPRLPAAYHAAYRRGTPACHMARVCLNVCGVIASDRPALVALRCAARSAAEDDASLKVYPRLFKLVRRCTARGSSCAPGVACALPSARAPASRTAAFAALTVSIDVTIGLLSLVPVQACCSTSAGADFPHHLVLASNLRRIYSVAPPAAAGGSAQDDRHVELTSGQAPERFYLSGVPSRVPTRSGQRRPSNGPRAAMFGLPFPIRRD